MLFTPHSKEETIEICRPGKRTPPPMAAVAPAPQDFVPAYKVKLVAADEGSEPVPPPQAGGCCCCCAVAAAASSVARRAASWCCRKIVSRPVGGGGLTRSEPAKRVLVAVAAGTEPLEAAAVADILDRAGARVVVATASEGLVVEAANEVRFVADNSVADIESEEFDLIVLPGGMVGSVNLRDCKQLENMVRKHLKTGRLCGAIGVAPTVTLAHWGMLRGFKATCYPALLGRLGDDGVIAVDSRVVADRNMVTSQGVGTAIEFALALVEQLYDKHMAEEVAGPLYVRPQEGVKYTIQEYNQTQWKCTGTPQVLVPVANGSEEMEALNLIDILRRAGARVTIASVEDMPHIITRHYKLNLIADVMLEKATEMEFDLIVMPGGLPGALKFTSTEKLVGLLKKQAESGKFYGAICASPAYVLEPHGLLKGKKATSFPPMAHLLTDQSACEYRVVVDSNLITSRAPGTATEFALAIVDKLFGQKKAVTVAKELVFM